MKDIVNYWEEEWRKITDFTNVTSKEDLLINNEDICYDYYINSEGIIDINNKLSNNLDTDRLYLRNEYNDLNIKKPERIIKGKYVYINIEKGIIEKVPSNNIYKGFKYSNGESSLFLGNNKLLSFQIFEFLADNTYVEYSLVQNNFYCLITSSHDRETDKLMTKILEYSENETEQRRKERLYFLSIMQYFVHNHRIIADPSPSDMEMKEYILSVNSNIILEIYIRGSYYDYNLNKKR